MNRTLSDSARKRCDRYQYDVLLCCIPLLIIGFYFYGIRVLYLAVINILTAMLLDLIILRLVMKRFGRWEPSSLATALIITMLLPPTAPYWLGPMGVSFALIVGKYPFGGAYSYPFSPAAVGTAFLTLSFPTQVFAYTAPLQQLDVGAGSFPAASSAAGALKLGGIPPFGVFDLFIGNIPGAVGTTCVVVLLTVFLYLAVRKSADFSTVCIYLASAAVFAFLFPRSAAGAFPSVVYELGAGSMLFGGLFLLCDPVILPRSRSVRWLYALLLGSASLLFRYNGAFEEGFCFALLICQALIPCLSALVRRFRHRLILQKEVTAHE